MTLPPDQQRWTRKLHTALAGPSRADLAEAPLLDFWRPVVSPYGVSILWGMASGRPGLGNT